MSAVVRCDGPTCTETTVPGSGNRTTWLSANRGLAKFDFHTAACMSEWASAQQKRDDRPCVCDVAQIDPHTKAQHDAAPMVVDGL